MRKSRWKKDVRRFGEAGKHEAHALGFTPLCCAVLAGRHTNVDARYATHSRRTAQNCATLLASLGALWPRKTFSSSMTIQKFISY